MANCFENIVNHVKTKSTHESASSFSVSTIDFFKSRKHPIYVNKNHVKPTVKNVVLPEKEEDIYLHASGYKLDKSYVNMNAFGYYMNSINKNNENSIVEAYTNKEKYNDEIIIEM